MVGWHHLLNGHEFEQTPGDSEGQGSLVCCSPWGDKESDMTERLNTTKNERKTKLFPLVVAQLSSEVCVVVVHLLLSLMKCDPQEEGIANHSSILGWRTP